MQEANIREPNNMDIKHNGEWEMAPHDYKAPRRTNNSLIAQARLSRGWTQTQLADAVGASQQQINAWETGVRKPKMQTLMKLAEALGIDWLELVRK